MANMTAGYYAVIPATVRYDADLSPNAKLLYGEITALAKADGCCWAANSYFAELYSVSAKSVSRWISQLSKKGYIVVEVVRDDHNEVKGRNIYISDAPYTQNCPPSPQNCPDPHLKNRPLPMDKNVHKNNTRENNTRESARAKKAYGPLENVMLTDIELQKLKGLYPEQAVMQQIYNLSIYMGSSGKRYASHYATLLNWFRRDAEQEASTLPATLVDQAEVHDAW